MAIIGLSDDTKRKLKAISPQAPKYTFQVSPDKKYIWVSNGKETKIYSISALERMRDSNGFSEPVRAMAREALDFAGKPEHKEKEIFSETLTIISGVKVYRDIMKRRFFAWIRGERVYRTRLSELEKEIKK